MPDTSSAPPSGAPLTAYETRRRHDAVDFARENVGLEGFAPSALAETRAADFVAGSIELEAFVRRPEVPVGEIKTFGPFGPRYEVGQPLRPLANGDWLIAIGLVESGEDAEYKLTSILSDPQAF